MSVSLNALQHVSVLLMGSPTIVTSQSLETKLYYEVVPENNVKSKGTRYQVGTLLLMCRISADRPE